LIIHAYVLMPSHMHIVCRAKEESNELSRIIQDFKKYTAKRITAFRRLQSTDEY